MLKTSFKRSRNYLIVMGAKTFFSLFNSYVTTNIWGFIKVVIY